MALRQLKSTAYNDEEMYDMSRGMGPNYEPPEYPCGLCFCISKDDLEKAGGEGAEPNATMRFSAMGEVTSTFLGREDCRIEVQLSEFAGDDGKFFDLETPACICFTGPELEKVELSNNAEMGDLIHLIGEARVESISENEFSGGMVQLQVTALDYEDETAEARAGG
jgi:hypothetical protein